MKWAVEIAQNSIGNGVEGELLADRNLVDVDPSVHDEKEGELSGYMDLGSFEKMEAALVGCMGWRIGKGQDFLEGKEVAAAECKGLFFQCDQSFP